VFFLCWSAVKGIFFAIVMFYVKSDVTYWLM